MKIHVSHEKPAKPVGASLWAIEKEAILARAEEGYHDMIKKVKKMLAILLALLFELPKKSDAGSSDDEAHEELRYLLNTAFMPDN